MLKRVARMYVSSEAVADEVVQETWLGVFQGIQRFEGRASLKTWIFRILTNRARSRGGREARSVPFSALLGQEVGATDPAVEPQRFLDSTDPLPGHWGIPPKRWGDDPEQWVTSNETLDFLRGALHLLPPLQRQVVEFRDIQEWTADEVCAVLDISEANQRVLLHRGRSKLRSALEKHFEKQVADA
jgi:RNA polymerase sigma-70 factor, ECF subfamily